VTEERVVQIRERSAVDEDQRRPRSGGVVVKEAGEVTFAGSHGSSDQDRAITAAGSDQGLSQERLNDWRRSLELFKIIWG
jgi:hypothetical protein